MCNIGDGHRLSPRFPTTPSNQTSATSIARCVAPGHRQKRFDVFELEEQLQQLRTATICTLNQMLDLKDLNTGLHSTRLAS
jgi:hypothetical protein